MISSDQPSWRVLEGLPEDQAWDCPECGVRASVRADFCEVCYAELDEFRLDPLDPAADVAEPLPGRFTPSGHQAASAGPADRLRCRRRA